MTSDLDAMTHTAPSQGLNSTPLTLPLSTSHGLCSSLAASSSQSNGISLDLSHLEITPPSAVGPTKTNYESTSKCPIGRYLKSQALTRTDLFSTHPPPPFPLHSVSCSLPIFDSTLFLSERNGVGSVDWPPIESALLPDGGNAGQDNDIGVQVSSVFSLTCADRSFTQTTKENAGNAIVIARKVPSSTAKKLNVIPLDNALPVSLMMSVDSPDSSQAAVLEKGKLANGSLCLSE